MSHRPSDRRSAVSRSIANAILLAVGAWAGLALVSALRQPRRSAAGRAPQPRVHRRDTARLTRTATIGPARDVPSLESLVLEVFRTDPVLQGQAIDISALGDNGVELTGWVSSARDTKLARTLARGVPGVRRVTANLRRAPTGASRT